MVIDMDRRIKYTKRVLNESLIRYLGKKEITKITVTEICQDADINRSTYYAHFLDPYDQLAKLKAELLGTMAEYILQVDTAKLPKGEAQYHILKMLLEHVERRREVFRILLGRSGDHNLQEEILAILGDKVFRSTLPDGYGPEEAESLLLYAANGCFGLFYRWLMAEDIPLEQTARRMADFTAKLMQQP